MHRDIRKYNSNGISNAPNGMIILTTRFQVTIWIPMLFPELNISLKYLGKDHCHIIY